MSTTDFFTNKQTPASLEHIDDEACRRFQGSIEFVGKRWSSGILLAITRGHTRFSEIVAAVPGLSDRLLSQRVKELEHEGVLERIVIPTTPVQISYRLTERGADLMKALEGIAEWGQRWNESSK